LLSILAIICQQVRHQCAMKYRYPPFADKP
jgi:hypothetical protein